jgi:hypothetical protein
MGASSYPLKKTLLTIAKILLTALFGIFYAPSIVYGVYLFICWIRIHFSDVYYGDCGFLLSAPVWVGVGLAIFAVTWYGAWRRSFYGLLFIVPLFMGVISTHLLPDSTPYATASISDAEFSSRITNALRDWFEKRQKFPADESEFWEAITRRTSPPQYPGGRAFYSKYGQRRESLPYVIIVAGNASGPRVADVSSRPGVVYYCVSTDLQEFWITMTGLQSDLAPTASLKQLAWWEKKAWIHGEGRDYSATKP